MGAEKLCGEEQRTPGEVLIPIKRRTLVLTASAKADLKNVHDFIAEDSAESAVRFLDRVLRELKRLAYNGVRGVSRDQLRPGLRMHPLGRYAIYFRTTDDHFVVIRIVHGARDRAALDFD